MSYLGMTTSDGQCEMLGTHPVRYHGSQAVDQQGHQNAITPPAFLDDEESRTASGNHNDIPSVAVSNHHTSLQRSGNEDATTVQIPDEEANTRPQIEFEGRFAEQQSNCSPQHRRKKNNRNRENARPSYAKSMHSAPRDGSGLNEGLSSALILETLFSAFKLEQERLGQAAEHAQLAQQRERVTLGRKYQHLQNELISSKIENRNLAKTIEQLEGQIKKYEPKVRTILASIDDIGNDMSRLRDEHSSVNRGIQDLFLHRDQLLADRMDAQQILDTCNDKLSNSNHDALAACKALQFRVEALEDNKISLETQLSEKVGLLAEARDQRINLEQRIQDIEQEKRDVQQLLEQHWKQITQKLSDMALALANIKIDGESQGKLDDCLLILKGIQAVQPMTAEDMKRVESLLEGYFGT
jgi:chromosome segregation ATPase